MQGYCGECQKQRKVFQDRFDLKYRCCRCGKTGVTPFFIRGKNKKDRKKNK